MKILTMLGARPEFIKAGSVSCEILKHKEVQEVIVHMGQYYNAKLNMYGGGNASMNIVKYLLNYEK